MEYKEFRAKTAEDAMINAALEFGVTTADLETLIVEKGSTGFLGIGAKPAVVKARVKTSVIRENGGLENMMRAADRTERKEETVSEQAAEKAPVKSEAAAPVQDDDREEEPFVEKTRVKSEPLTEEEKTNLAAVTEDYLNQLFKAMEFEAQITISFEEEDNVMDIDVEGPDMGLLIGKRGQTLDSLQYLISLFVNRKSRDKYVRIKLDTENYRARRKETLENLAKNIAFKVKRTRRSFTLEPMNPYERRIIHSTLQGDRNVATRSDGEEPYRKVTVYLKKRDRRDA